MNNLKKIFALLLIATTLMLSGCWGDDKDKKEVIKIGVILPLTGGAAFVGQPMKNAIMLALEKHKNIDIVFNDSKASPKDSVAIYKQLRQQGIKHFIGPATSGGALAIAPIVENDKDVVIISPSASNYKLSQYKNFNRVELSDKQGATKQALLAYKKLGWTNISILYINNEYGTGVSQEFAKQFKRLGGNINISSAYNQETTNFRNHINKISNFKNDAIFIVAQNKYPVIIKQLRELKDNTTIYATPVIKDSNTFETLGTFAGKIIFAYYGQFNTNNELELSANFKQAYQNKYQQPATYYAALAYDSIQLLLNKIRGKSNNTINGITGKMKLDNNGDVDKDIILFEWNSQLKEL